MSRETIKQGYEGFVYPITYYITSNRGCPALGIEGGCRGACCSWAEVCPVL